MADQTSVVPPVEQVQPAQPAQPVQSAAQPPAPAEQTPPQSVLLTEEERNSYTQEVLQNGTLSEESFRTLEARGLPRQMVESYIEGQKARQNEANESLTSSIGGMDRFNAISAWAQKNMTPEAREDYNRIFSSGNKTAIIAGLEKLNKEFEQANPQPPTQVLAGGAGAPPVGDIFHSRQEMAAAMTDKKYWSDPETRRLIAEKIQRSLKAGVKLA